MILKRIGLIVIGFTFYVCSVFSYEPLVFATECPPDYPIHCKAWGFCCAQGNPFACTFPYTNPNCLPEECVIEELYIENSKETESLRDFRDNVLAQTLDGQQIIKLYYQWSPVIVKAMEEDEEFKEDVKEMIDGVLGLIKEGEE